MLNLIMNKVIGWNKISMDFVRAFWEDTIKQHSKKLCWKITDKVKYGSFKKLYRIVIFKKWMNWMKNKFFKWVYWILPPFYKGSWSAGFFCREACILRLGTLTSSAGRSAFWVLAEFAHYYVTYFYMVNNSFINQHNRFIYWFQTVYSISITHLLAQYYLTCLIKLS